MVFIVFKLYHLIFLILVIHYCIIDASTSVLSPTSGSGSDDQTDHIALLAIKRQLVDHPNGVLTTWNNSVHHCNWDGVTCALNHSDSGRGRVTLLDLNSRGLTGTISPFIGNLTFLQTILLYNNNLYGRIPSELGHLSNLQQLALFQNTLSGPIPANLSRCLNLRILKLSFNMMTGQLPVEFGSLTRLEHLSLNNNNFTGPLFDIISNLTSLKVIITSYNAFTGTIPDAIGHFRNLYFLYVVDNKLSGTLPKSLFNLSSLVYMGLAYNQFQGQLPKDIGFTLPRLESLFLYANRFSGSIPSTLVNLTHIVELDLGLNRFIGRVPRGFEQLRNLTNLGLAGNFFTDDINFVATLVNCTKLEVIDLRASGFAGELLPESITNLNPGLQKLGLGNNNVTGKFPAGIVNLTSLTILDLSNCVLSGSLPHDFGKLVNLQQILLYSNILTGKIPESLGLIPRLTDLELYENGLEGGVPLSLGNSESLLNLNLSDNKLNGSLDFLKGSAKFVTLDLSRNHLHGSIPSEISEQKSVGYFGVSDNMLSGVIPDGIARCVALQQLYLDANSFHGPVPSSLASLSSLTEIDLSDNKFSGSIPAFFSKFTSLHYLNLSYNDFEGEVPTKAVFASGSEVFVTGNNKLCGGILDLHLPKCAEKKILETSRHRRKSVTLKVIIPTICVSVGVVAIIVGLYLAYIIRSKNKLVSPDSEIGKSFLKVSYDMLLKATDGFSSDKLLGAGTFGSVFEGILDGKTVAVKVLNLEHRGASKSFIAECNALRNIRHRNLVGIITACSSNDFQRNDFKALVYEFMPNGSLDKWLNNIAAGSMNILQRVDIAIDMAHALYYLHHELETPIVHCDLKPSNILLDRDMIAHVGDFGLAKILTQPLHPNQSSTIGVRGTVGYVAPEYGLGSEVSSNGDVYSYGVLLLELMTGKRPTDSMFTEGFDLHMYAKAAFPDQVMEIVDPSLQDNEIFTEEEVENIREIQDNNDRQKRECILTIVSVGVECSNHSPEDRMKIPDAISRLLAAKDNLVNATRTRN